MYDVIHRSFEEGQSDKSMMKLVKSRGGLLAHLGTTDCREVEHRIQNGDAHAKLIYDAMALNVAKFIGKTALGVCGKVDAILLTGGIDLAKWNILLNSAAVEAGADPVTLGIGNLLAVILDFIIVAFAMFLLVKGMNKLASLKKKEEESAPEEEPKPTSEDLLTEIRDLLKEQQK